MGKFEELVNDTVIAFEESTGEPPQPPELGEIQAIVRDYIEEEK
jgi:hypothetical protein